MFKKVFVVLSVLSIFANIAAYADDPAKIFHSLCSPCHGAKGEGKKGKAPSLKDSEFVKNGSDEEVKDTIKNGRSMFQKRYSNIRFPMPPRISLTDEEMNSLVKFLKTEIAK